MTRHRPASAEQPVPPRPLVVVKGTQDGLSIVVSPGDHAAIEASMRDQMSRHTGTFFRGASVELTMPAGQLDLELVRRLAPLIAEREMSLVRIVAQPAETPPRRRRVSSADAAAPAPAEAVVAAGTLRSGQRLAREGTLVIIGDVNPGAEVSAGGSVVVWGRLRGKVEAGLAQDAAVVCALDLAPTQLRIGAALARAPEEPGRTPVPEIAREEDGQIVVRGWHP